jgi:flagellar biogenesis protein FliO
LNAAVPDLGTTEMLTGTFRVIAALAGVLLLAVVVLRHLLPRFLGRAQEAQGPFRMVARYQLEPRKTLYMVEAGNQLLLLGTSETEIRYLATLPPGAAGGTAPQP